MRPAGRLQLRTRRAWLTRSALSQFVSLAWAPWKVEARVPSVGCDGGAAGPVAWPRPPLSPRSMFDSGEDFDASL